MAGTQRVTCHRNPIEPRRVGASLDESADRARADALTRDVAMVANSREQCSGSNGADRESGIECPDRISQRVVASGHSDKLDTNGGVRVDSRDDMGGPGRSERVGLASRPDSHDPAESATTSAAGSGRPSWWCRWAMPEQYPSRVPKVRPASACSVREAASASGSAGSATIPLP
jgi:hypothetical protein